MIQHEKVNYICKYVKYTLLLWRQTLHYMELEKKVFLLPHRFQLLGWIVSAAAAVCVAGALLLTKTPYLENLPAILGTVSLVAGLFLVGFSREKTEDEFTLHLRVSSAVTALLIVFGLWILKTVASVILARLLPLEVFGPIQIFLNFLTGFVAIFVLYLALFKIRLAIFNKKSAYEE